MLFALLAFWLLSDPPIPSMGRGKKTNSVLFIFRSPPPSESGIIANFFHNFVPFLCIVRPPLPPILHYIMCQRLPTTQSTSGFVHIASHLPPITFSHSPAYAISTDHFLSFFTPFGHHLSSHTHGGIFNAIKNILAVKRVGVRYKKKDAAMPPCANGIPPCAALASLPPPSLRFPLPIFTLLHGNQLPC